MRMSFTINSTTKPYDEVVVRKANERLSEQASESVHCLNNCSDSVTKFHLEKCLTRRKTSSTMLYGQQSILEYIDAESERVSRNVPIHFRSSHESVFYGSENLLNNDDNDIDMRWSEMTTCPVILAHISVNANILNLIKVVVFFFSQIGVRKRARTRSNIYI